MWARVDPRSLGFEIMLERNSIQCWVTTSDRVILPEILTSSGESDVVTCTVKLPTKQASLGRTR